MIRTIVLDAGPLGLVSNPGYSEQNHACAQWLQAHLSAGARVIIPEITDYEIRRELLRAGKTRGIAKLDTLAKVLEYLPISTAAMRRAADLWALARQRGQQAASDAALDADMILAAQADTLAVANTIIATTNVGHLAAFTTADVWQNIVVT